MGRPRPARAQRLSGRAPWGRSARDPAPPASPTRLATGSRPAAPPGSAVWRRRMQRADDDVVAGAAADHVGSARARRRPRRSRGSPSSHRSGTQSQDGHVAGAPESKRGSGAGLGRRRACMARARTATASARGAPTSGVTGRHGHAHRIVEQVDELEAGVPAARVEHAIVREREMELARSQPRLRDLGIGHRDVKLDLRIALAGTGRPRRAPLRGSGRRERREPAGSVPPCESRPARAVRPRRSATARIASNASPHTSHGTGQHRAVGERAARAASPPQIRASRSGAEPPAACSQARPLRPRTSRASATSAPTPSNRRLSSMTKCYIN